MNLLTPSESLDPPRMDPAHTPVDLAKALVSDVRSLGLVSQSEVVLQDFSRRVLDSVRTIDAAVQVDEYSGHEFLDLISRLNQEVAPHLQEQAAPSAKPGPIHIWVIKLADKLSAEQQTIIFRLIELFPALPFRVIWLSQQPLQAWNERTPTDGIFLDLDAVDQPLRKASDMPDPLDQAFAEPREMPEATTNRISQKTTIATAVAGVAILGAVAWMSASSDPSAPALTPASAAASAPAAASETVPTATATPATALASAANPTQKSTPQVIEAPQTASASKAPVAQTPKALPEVARMGARWFKTLPADAYVVEHGVFNSLEQAQKLKAKHQELGTARIIAMRKTPHTDDWQFAVVTGPFRSEDRAKTYVSRLDWRTSTRIRVTERLKPLLASAS